MLSPKTKAPSGNNEECVDMRNGVSGVPLVFSQHSVKRCNRMEGHIPSRDSILSHDDLRIRRGAPAAQQGSAYVASLINALMNSQSGNDSVSYSYVGRGRGLLRSRALAARLQPDGIPPQDLASTDIPGDFRRYGFRLPKIVISPNSKRVTGYTGI